MTPFFRLLPLAMAGLASIAHSAAVTIECPASITPTTSVSVVPAGWSVVAGDTPLPFDGLAVFDGHPSELASLVPDREIADAPIGARGESEWDFEGGAKNIWVGCSYARTTASLARAVPDGVVKCRVRATHEEAGWQLAPKIVCE